MHKCKASIILASCSDGYKCQTDEYYLKAKEIESRTNIEVAKHKAQKYVNKPENNTTLTDTEVKRVAMETCVKEGGIPNVSSWDGDIICENLD